MAAFSQKAFARALGPRPGSSDSMMVMGSSLFWAEAMRWMTAFAAACPLWILVAGPALASSRSSTFASAVAGSTSSIVSS